MSDESALEESRIEAIKRTVKRIVAKREKAILNRLVAAHRDNELTQEQAYSSIMLIAELRSAEGHVGKEDIQ